jgi:lysophospholipase L1-like esterase
MSDAQPYSLLECASARWLFDYEGNLYAAGYPKDHFPGPGHSGWFLVSYARDGSFRWASPIEGPSLNGGVSNVVVGADGNVYALAEHHLHAYRKSDGASLWDVEVPELSNGFGVYADNTGITVGATIRYDYAGNLVHPVSKDGRANFVPLAQEPGGAVYTAWNDDAHCVDKKPYYGIRITRWTLNGVAWEKTIRPPAPPASREECGSSVHITQIHAAPGGGVVVGYENAVHTLGQESVLFRLDTKGSLKWTHATQRGWHEQSSQAGFRIAANGEIVTLEHGRELCDRNFYGECGVVAVDFLDAATGAPTRSAVFVRNVVQSSEGAVYEPQPNGGETLAVGPDAVYLDLELDGEYQIMQLSVPGLGGEYDDLLRADYGGPAVTAVSPRRGLAGGGTTVKITGARFLGATQVYFGGVPSPSFTVNSGTSITAVSPKGPSGKVDITVATPAGTSAVTTRDAFTYEPFATYVALGDSFASGLGSFSYLTGTTTGGHPCYRATNGYAEQLAGLTHDTLAFVACQGSSIGDSNTNSALIGGPAPQLNQLSSATRLVTLSIGGIDVGFPQVIASCIGGPYAPSGSTECAGRDERAAASALEWLEYGRPPGNYPLPGIDEATGGIAYSENQVFLPSLTELYEQIAARAPNARIFVIGYPHLLESDISPTKDCQVGSISPVTNYSIRGTDVFWLNSEADAVDSIIGEAASAASSATGRNIAFVDPRQAFTGHGLCDTGSPYINPLLFSRHFSGPIKKWWTPKLESFHPNTEGQNALAAIVRAAIAQG